MQNWQPHIDSKSAVLKKLDGNEDAVLSNYRKSQTVFLVMKADIEARVKSLNKTE